MRDYLKRFDEFRKESLKPLLALALELSDVVGKLILDAFRRVNCVKRHLDPLHLRWELQVINEYLKQTAIIDDGVCFDQLDQLTVAIVEALDLGHLVDQALVVVLLELAPQLFVLAIQLSDEVLDACTSESAELLLDVSTNPEVFVDSIELDQHVVHVGLCPQPNLLHVSAQEGFP